MVVHAAPIQSKPVGSFRPDPQQLRKVFVQADLIALGESMKRLGQIVPVLARSDGLLIDGERRWRAAQLAGMAHMNVIVTDEDLTPSKILEIQFASSHHRLGLGDFELFLGFSSWKKLNPTATDKELAESISRDPSWVCAVLSLAGCTEAIQGAARDGKLSASIWYELSKLPLDRQDAALSIPLSGASRARLRAATRELRHPPKEIEQPLRKRLKCILPARDGDNPTLTINAPSITMRSVIALLKELLREAQKAEADSIDARTFEKILFDKAKPKSSESEEVSCTPASA